MTIAWQPAFVRNKMLHPKTVQCKTVAVTSMSNKPPECCPQGQRAGRLKTKGRKFQYQHVDLDLKHNTPTPPPMILMTYLRKKRLILPRALVDIPLKVWNKALCLALPTPSLCWSRWYFDDLCKVWNKALCLALPTPSLCWSKWYFDDLCKVWNKALCLALPTLSLCWSRWYFDDLCILWGAGSDTCLTVQFIRNIIGRSFSTVQWQTGTKLLKRRMKVKLSEKILLW